MFDKRALFKPTILHIENNFSQIITIDGMKPREYALKASKIILEKCHYILNGF